MDNDLKMILSQVVDNQLLTLNKLNDIIKLLSDLTNTIVKYDNDYQNDLAKGGKNDL